MDKLKQLVRHYLDENPDFIEKLEPSQQEIDNAISEFRGKFSPEKLQELSDEEILRWIPFNPQSNNDTMSYYLEHHKNFKNFGGIGGGSAGKMGYYQGNDGQYKNMRDKVTSREEVLRHRKIDIQLLADIYEYINNSDFDGLTNYIDNLNNIAVDSDADYIYTAALPGFVWVRKYFAVLFPEKFIQIFGNSFCEGISNISGLGDISGKVQGYGAWYKKMNQIASMAPELGINTNVLSNILWRQPIVRGEEVVSVIDKLFNDNIDGYVKWRKGELSDRAWDESYKWDVLKPFSRELGKFQSATSENVSEIINLYQKNNPTEGTWIQYLFFTRAKTAIDAGNAEEVAQFINDVWSGQITDAASTYKELTSNNLNANEVGYLSAAKDPANNPLYRGEFFAGLKNDLKIDEPDAIESRYIVYTQITLELGNKLINYLEVNDEELFEFHKEYPAISGQDFLYFLYFGINNKKILELTKSFIKDADEGSLKTKKYKIQYNGCKVDASFGQGGLAKVPWIGFKYNENTNHINLLYFKEVNKLVLAFGIPEEKKSTIDWTVENETVSEHYINEFTPSRYGNSLYINEYNPHDLPESLVNDIDEALEVYKTQSNRRDISRSNFWIFQGNPDVFDIEEYLSTNIGNTINWSANQNADKMKPGDIVYLWSAKDGGLAGFGAITDTPKAREANDNEQRFGEKKVDIKLLRYFEDKNRLKRSDLQNNTILSSSKIVKQPQGSNFLLSENESFELQKLIAKKGITRVWLFTPGTDDEYLQDIKDNNRIRIGWDKLGDLSKYINRDEIKQALYEKYDEGGENQVNNTTACDNFINEMQYGDIVILKSGLLGLTGIGQITGDYAYEESLNSFNSLRPASFSKFSNWEYNPLVEPKFDNAAKNLPVKTMTEISAYPEFIERIINCMSLDNKKITEDPLMPEAKISLNTILYGPPGTGKTYQAINVIAEQLLSDQAGQDRSVEEVLADQLKDLTWWQVTVLALYHANRHMKVAELSETEIITSYATYVKNRTNSIRPTLWGTLQERSDKDSSNVSFRIEGVEYFNKNENSEWGLTDEGRAYAEEALSDINTDVQAESGSDWKKFYRTITFHQSYSYEEFIEGIRPVMQGEDNSGQISYEIKDGMFKEMCVIAKRDPVNKYLLIIDEINRGNISKIFGELITLLEDDKRESMVVKLPYSHEDFSIPKNLYVLGTMNTADRSIALLDIALRRRFTFKEVMPDYDLIVRNIDGVDLARLLQTINEKIEIMTDRDHQIGHSYFMNAETAEDLHAAWYNKILPLLSEYFYNDWERLIEVVGEHKSDKQIGFVEKKSAKEIQSLFGPETEYSEAVVGKIKQYSVSELPNALKAIYEKDQPAD